MADLSTLIQPSIRFLFVGSELCPLSIFRNSIRLPSDSTSRWTPLPSANTSCYRACSGLSPPSYRPCWAHRKKDLPPSRAAGLFFFVLYLSPMSALLPQAPPVNAYAFSSRQTYSKFFSLNGHSSTTTQPRHNGLRALQILRPCQINQ